MDLRILDSVDIPADAAFAIGSSGLMGDALIEIKPTGKETRVFLPHGQETVIEGVKAGGLSDLQSTAEQVAKKVDVVLDDVRLALKEAQAVMTKINTGALSEATITDFRESMAHLNKTMTRVDEKVLGEENALNLKTALAELRDAATSFKNAAKSIEEQTRRLGPMFDKLEPAIAKADKTLTTADDSLVSIKKAADSLSQVARNITTGKGLLGALMNDAELKTDFKDLIANMKRNGVLWYKNTADKERAKEEETRPPVRTGTPFRR